MNTLHHTRRAMGGILLIISLLTALLTAGALLPAPNAQASQTDGVDTLTSDMVDGITMQVKRQGGTEWETVPTDGAGEVSVFDLMRYTVNFHIPQGTLNRTNTLTLWPKLNDEVHGWMSTASNQGWRLNGNIMIGGQEAGTYTIESRVCRYGGSFSFSYGNNNTARCPATTSNDGLLTRYLTRINLTFNQESRDRNQTMDITDGQIYYEQDARWLGGGNETVTVGFAGHETPLRLTAPVVALDKQAVGEPVFNRKEGEIKHRWKMTVTNTGEYALPDGWRLYDQIFDNAIPAGANVNAGTCYAGFYGSNAVTIQGDSAKTSTGTWQQCTRNGMYWGGVGQHVTMSALPPGGTVTFEFTSTLLLDTHPDQYVNRAVLISDYMTPLTAAAQQPNPAKGNPNLSIVKQSNGDPVGKTISGDDCSIGDEGCIARIPWKVTVSNTGDGDLDAGWQLIDELGYESNALQGHRFDKTDIALMQDGLAKEGYPSTVTQVRLAGNKDGSLNGWKDVPDGDLPAFEYTGRIIGVKLTMNAILKAGASLTHTYWSSDDWGLGGNAIGAVVNRYRNRMQGCGWLGSGDGREWYCWVPSFVDSGHISGQYQTKSCGSYPYDFVGKPDKPFAYCNVSAHIVNADKGKEIVFHESPRSKAYAYQSSAVNNINGFTLSPYNSTETLLEAPTDVGETTSSTKYAGESGKPLTITKTADGEWDIVFPADWQWKQMNGTNSSTNYNFTVNYHPKHIADWLDYAEPVWTKQTDNSYRFGVYNTVHGKVNDGMYDFTSSDAASQTVYPRSSAKTRYAQNPDGARGTRATYRITGNWLAGDMNPDGDTVGITDTLTIPDDASAILKEGSVSVWASNSSYDLYRCAGTPSTGNNVCWAGSHSSNDKYKLDPSAYTIRYDTAGHTLTIDGLPDNKVLWIEYDIVFNSTANTIPNVRNTVTFTAGGAPNQLVDPASDTSTITIYQSAAVAKIQGVYLKKTDSANSTLVLADAVFDLQRWDGTQYVHDRTITTSDTTASVVDKLECGTAYRLTETQAPVDYNLDSTPYEFALKACEAPTGLKPDGWHGAEHITMDTITRTNQRNPMKHAMPMTGNGQWLIILLTVSVLTAVGGLIVLVRTGRR